jgi:hypothetical protein
MKERKEGREGQGRGGEERKGRKERKGEKGGRKEKENCSVGQQLLGFCLVLVLVFWGFSLGLGEEKGLTM